MAVFYGTVVAGQTLSSAFTLAATDRALLVGVSSAAANTWYAAFQPIVGGAWLRYLDPWSSVTSLAREEGAGGHGDAR